MSASPKFYLIQEIKAHGSDVRAMDIVRIRDEHYLCASGSRDGSTKLWDIIDTRLRLPCRGKAMGHSGFVSSVLLVPATELKGLILITGGNDSQINVYDLETPAPTGETVHFPIFSLNGHKGVVTALARIGEQLFSVSSDGTMRIWDLRDKVNTKVLNVSTMPLWDIVPLECEKVAIACADKTIVILNTKVWTEHKVITGHLDCVRSLAPVSRDTFLSTGNDGSILEWHAITGELVNRHASSRSFLYCIRHHPQLGVTVACGEGGNATVFVRRSLNQQVFHPCQSVWTCVINDNATLITGSSDGFLRVFSFDQTRCSDDLKTAFDESVAVFARRQPMGDHNICGPDALQRPGRVDGDMIIVRDAPGSYLHQWNGSEWKLIGEVMGGANVDNSKGLSKAYDYEFDVDVEEGKPPYKLYYNKNQNPIEVAEAFILVHKLPSSYKSQIVDFILRNTESSSSTLSEAMDPFTGGSRYVPGGGSTLPAPASSLKSSLFPLSSYIIMSNVDLKKLEAKVRTFACVKEVPEDTISDMISLGTENHKPGAAGLALLYEALENWPEDCIYPILDVIRLALRNEANNSLLCDGENGKTLMCSIKKRLLSDSNINVTFSVRVLGNMVAHKSGADLVMNEADELLVMVSVKLRSSHDLKLEVAVATLLANLSVLFGRSGDREMNARLLTVINETLELFQGSEGRARALAALGTVVTKMGSVSLPEAVRFILTEWSSASSDTALSANIKTLFESFPNA